MTKAANGHVSSGADVQGPRETKHIRSCRVVQLLAQRSVWIVLSKARPDDLSLLADSTWNNAPLRPTLFDDSHVKIVTLRVSPLADGASRWNAEGDILFLSAVILSLLLFSALGPSKIKSSFKDA